MPVSLDRYDVVLTHTGYHVRVDGEPRVHARSRAAASDVIARDVGHAVVLIPVDVRRWIAHALPS